ncbi:23S rRNA (pseudouridine(1915)-N(3))-methyltransferase RlmH [Patescibacteria group bacterium]|nr:23S rRNA (pseudouridine(1915)-N(3))-methyltransferase RlmH [Patescibacteria group bacterium]
MQLQILQIAPTKDKNLLAIEQEYEKRIKPFANLTTTTLKPSKSDQCKQAQEEEKDKFLPRLDPKANIIALDENGPQLSSQQFAEAIQKTRDHGPGRIQFLIGGSHGLHPEVRKKANQTLSLSKMTFTHEMVRIFLKEQLYRAFTIIENRTYHK